jgi:hypothetical protein
MWIRNGRVYQFRIRLIDEENQWWNSHLEEYRQQLEGKHFLGFHSLPSYEWMLLMFWLPLSHWERNLKPYNEYYGIKEKEA